MAWAKEGTYACTVRDGALILAIKSSDGKVYEKSIDFEKALEFITDQGAGLVRITAKFPSKCRDCGGKIRFQEVAFYDPYGSRGKKMICLNCMEGIAA